MAEPFEPIWAKLPEDLQAEILSYASEHGGKEAARQYWETSGFASEDTFYQKILKELAKRRHLAAQIDPESGLSAEEEQLLEDFKNGKVGYDRIQKELATRVFRKILKNPESLQVRDWLQSELVKLKQDETMKQKNALERFVNSLFGGFIPAIYCPHCHKSTIIPTEALGELLDATEPAKDN